MKRVSRFEGSLKLAAVLSVAVWSGSAMAEASTVLIKGDGQPVTSADVQADAERIPDNMRNAFLAKPKSTQELATNLYIRRVMAARGKTAGLDKSAETQAAIAIATDKILSDAYLAKFNADNAPSEQTVEAQARAQYKAHPEQFMETAQVHAAHILIQGANEKSATKAKELLKKLQGGADFTEMAKTESADTANASKGGDLGFFAKGRMVPDFEKAAFALKPGQLSEPVKTPFGYHIIKVLETKPERKKTYEESAPELKKQITAEMLNKARTEAVQKVQAGMTVDQAAIEAFSKQHENK